MWSNESFIVRNENLGIDRNLRMRPTVFEILSKTPFECSLKFSFLSKTKPRFKLVC